MNFFSRGIRQATHEQLFYYGPLNPMIPFSPSENKKMQNIEWNAVIAAYQDGLTADIIQAEYESGQGVIWTVPPCSPAAMECAGRQFSRSRAQSVRHIRRAVLHRRDQPDQAVVIATELPVRRQQVRDLETAEEFILRRILSDDALTALEAAFAPSAKEAV